MSKQVVECCDIREVNPLFLKRAMEKMLKLFDGRLSVENENRLRIYCSKLSCYNVTVEIVDQQIKIRGEARDVHRVKEIVEQFYEAMIYEDLPNCTGVEVDKEDLLLTIEV